MIGRPRELKSHLEAGGPAQAGRSKIRVVVADHQPLILLGIEHLLANSPDFAIVAHCTSAKQCREALGRHQPDILILDPCLPEDGAIALLDTLAEEGASVRVLILAESIDEFHLAEFLRRGVRGVVLKGLAISQLAPSQRTIHEGGEWHEKVSYGRVVKLMLGREDRLRETASRLTPRELELARLAAQGLDNQEIANRLSIQEGTVKVHLHRIYRKLQVRDRVALVLRVREAGL